MPIRLGGSLGTNSGTASSGTIVLTTTADVRIGDLIVVFVGIGATSTGETLTVTDSVGNVYVTDVTSVGSTTAGFFIARTIATIALPSGSSITGTLGAASVNRLIAAANFTGIDSLSILDKTSAASGTDVNWNSGSTLQTVQTQELIIGGSTMFSITQGTSTPGAGLIELHDFGTTATAMTTAWKVVTVTGIQSVSGTWAGTGGAENRRDGVATYRRAPEGTTTSTSSTSASTFSTSSTSSSISSTSNSTSSTSGSTSQSSTSSSLSSTSSSISSTSSSTSSTSASSTSASTSLSSTSSSISSTSQSSTSISSTSSSISISSTSSSISSTSSSVSSTSHSTSSTSFSSTSSSSSTSTTTLLPNYDFSYQDTLSNKSIGFIQSVSATEITGTGSYSLPAFTSTSGNMIVISAADDSASVAGTVLSLNDNFGNIYRRIGTGQQTNPAAGQDNLSMWYAYNIVGGPGHIITLKYNSGASNNNSFVAQEFSGFGVTDPLDRTAVAGGASTAPSSGATGVLSQTYELVVVGLATDTVQTPTLGAGYSNLVNNGSGATTPTNVAQESKIVQTNSAVTGNFTITSTNWACRVVTFKGNLQATATDLINKFNNAQYSDALGDDGDYFIEYGSEYMIRNYQRINTNNTDSPTFTWKGRTTESTLISPMLIQIYNVSTAAWETLAIANKVPADTDFSLSVTQTANVSNYYDTSNTVTFRSYQQVI